MNKFLKATEGAIFSVFVIVGFFALINTSYAFATIKSFGGTITNTKATRIDSLENSNYKCSVPGETITVRPTSRSMPTTYFIPSRVRSETRNKISRNQLVLGLYTVTQKTSITCIFQGTPPTEQIVSLDTLKLYGNSKR